ncbi:DUF4158 domain-containing protein [Streptomyces sp. B8F3]|uniref:DUF4158 domain-containing protein n=1 Tax=Streptomyces sp. B8F3 TaxID=3153573 RepID=UPI00325F6918
MATRVFSDEELEALRSFPAIGKDELIRYFTLTSADEAFLRTFLRPQTVLGAAVQLCTLPWLGFVPDEVSAAPSLQVGLFIGGLLVSASIDRADWPLDPYRTWLVAGTAAVAVGLASPAFRLPPSEQLGRPTAQFIDLL